MASSPENQPTPNTARDSVTGIYELNQAIKMFEGWLSETRTLLNEITAVVAEPEDPEDLGELFDPKTQELIDRLERKIQKLDELLANLRTQLAASPWTIQIDDWAYRGAVAELNIQDVDVKIGFKKLKISALLKIKENKRITPAKLASILGIHKPLIALYELQIRDLYRQRQELVSEQKLMERNISMADGSWDLKQLKK